MLDRDALTLVADLRAQGYVVVWLRLGETRGPRCERQTGEAWLHHPPLHRGEGPEHSRLRQASHHWPVPRCRWASPELRANAPHRSHHSPQPADCPSRVSRSARPGATCCRSAGCKLGDTLYDHDPRAVGRRGSRCHLRGSRGRVAGTGAVGYPGCRSRSNGHGTLSMATTPPMWR